MGWAQKQPPELFYKKLFLKILQYSQENAFVRFSFLITLQNKFIKESPTLVFSCEYCEIFKSTTFEKHLPTDASAETCRLHLF